MLRPPRSRPVWARGLKYLLRLAVGLAEAVASRVGAGIEIAGRISAGLRDLVASRVGAGIEISVGRRSQQRHSSRPVWARGLKSRDNHPHQGDYTVASRVGAGIEICR